MALTGPDISAFQPDVDFQRVRAAGHAFAFIKATEGDDYTNSHFKAHARAAKSAGLFRGGYHFASGGNPVTEANYFVRVLKDAGAVGQGSLPPVLDYESAISNPSGWVQRWVAQVERLTNVRPIIYCGKSYGDTLDQAWRCPLWLAAYVQDPGPWIPQPWHVWTFWQFTDSASVPGIGGGVDLSRFNGGPAELAALCQSTPPGPPVLGRPKAGRVSRGPWIVSYSRGLHYLGYYTPESVDFFTVGLEAATKAFQTNHARFGLKPSGVVDAKTLAVFRDAVAWRQKHPRR